MASPSPELRFDRVAPAPGAQAAVPCANCKGPLLGQYWRFQSHVVCGACRERLDGSVAGARASASLGKAALLGGATALACGVAYAVFVAVSNFQLALATIGIAFVIAKVVRKASGGLGGVRFQVLAVLLTYLASAMGYFPAVWSGLKEGASHTTAAAARSDGASAAPSSADTREASDATEANDATKPADGAHAGAAAHEKPSLGGFALAVVVLLGLTLAAPFLSVVDAPIGMLIVLFGLWEAWKLTRAVPIVIDGPYRVAPAGSAAIGEPRAS